MNKTDPDGMQSKPEPYYAPNTKEIVKELDKLSSKQKGNFEMIAAMQRSNAKAGARLGFSMENHGLISRRTGETDLIVTHRQVLIGSGFRSSKRADDYEMASRMGFERMWTENAWGQVYVYDVASGKLYQYDRFGDKFTPEKFKRFDPIQDKKDDLGADLFKNPQEFLEKNPEYKRR